MPSFDLVTNIQERGIPEDFMEELATVLGKALGTDADSIVIRINPGQLMYLGGIDDPCGHAFLGNIGNLGAGDYIKHSKVISEKVGELGIIPARLFIKFDHSPWYAVDADGTTFKEKHGL